MKKSEILFRQSESIPYNSLSLLPTPLHRLTNTGKILGINLWCKRDDLTGFAFGGNKTRKLDYLVKEAVDSGADSIITFGSNQSNWCRMAAAAAVSAGLDVFLVLAGKKPAMPSANLLLDLLVGANIEHIDTDDEEIIMQKCKDVTADLTKKGRSPFFIPVGGSVPIGCTGYVRALAEILEYEESSAISFDRIILASGSAGTQAGLVAGKILSGWEGEIIGMAVSRSSEEHHKKVSELVMQTLSFYGNKADKQQVENSVIVDDGYIGEGYRINSAECDEAIRLFASSEGIFLDEVYTGKAAAGLIDYARRGIIGAGENILFLHTGGAVQLFE